MHNTALLTAQLREPPQSTDPDAAAKAATEAFADHVQASEFPCVGAKATLSQGTLQVATFGALGDRTNDARLLARLGAFASHLDSVDLDGPELHSLAAIFEEPQHTDELRFEALVWSQLQRLHTLDHRSGARWAADVSTDPDSPKFSLSLAGHPFFIIGLHPGASRIARRFSTPALVFNSHRQFERLREDGRYARMQAATRSRDMALQGSINPNLADFGTASESRQYSGREVSDDWRCPFHVMGQR